MEPRRLFRRLCGVYAVAIDTVKIIDLRLVTSCVKCVRYWKGRRIQVSAVSRNFDTRADAPRHMTGLPAQCRKRAILNYLDDL